jgi:DNA-binding Lrp family transcriptional regulator
MNTFTKTEQHILHIIQSDFPLTERPYQAIGKAIGRTEYEVIDILQSLKQRNILRQISAIFNSRFLGFNSALISFHVPEQQLDHTASVINTHPGVSHNYYREHLFNLWFTLSIPKRLDIKKHTQILARMTSCRQYLYLPSVRMFKRKVQLALTDTLPSLEAMGQSSEVSPRLSRKITLPLKIQRGIMNELQKDLSLSPTPFQEIAERCGVKEDMLFHFLHFLKTSHTMSRFAGILNHRTLGFTANAMVVWEIPEQTILPFVEDAATYPAVSHCYERVTYPEWPYNLYTMIHGTSTEGTQTIINELSSKFDMKCYEILYSRKEYKKQRVNYFSQDIYAWDKQHVHGK